MFNKITSEDYRKAKEVDIVSLLNSYGITHEGNKYCCPFHNEKIPSAVVGNANKLNCFGQCNGVEYKNAKKDVAKCKCYSTIDLVMHMENCDEFTAIRKLIGSNIEPVKKKDSVEVNKPKYDYDFGLRISKPLDKHNIGYIKDYLNKRCILNTLSIADEIGLEIRHNYYKDKNYICYNFKNYNFIIQKALDRSSKRNFGSPAPAYFKMNDSNEWYITEGIEDCLSLLLAHKFNVVCLNSLSNMDKFISSMNEKNEYIIALDNDIPGNQAKQYLLQVVKKTKRVYDEFYKFATKNSLKDINECFIYAKEMKKNC